MDSRVRPFLDNADESVISIVFLVTRYNLANYQSRRILWVKGPTIRLVTSLRMEANLCEVSRQNELLLSLLDGTIV